MDSRDCSRTRGGAGRNVGARFSMAVCLVILIGACSSIPDAANPVEWYKSAEQAVLGGDKAADEADVASSGAPAPAYTPPEISGRDRPFPNLGEGPERPVPRTAAETERLTEGLVADRARSLHSDRGIPLQGMSGERSTGLPMSGGDLPLGAAAPAVPAAPSSAEVIRTQIGQAAAQTEGGAQRPADSRRPSPTTGAVDRSARAVQAASAPAATTAPRQAGSGSAGLAFSDTPPPSGTSAPPPRPRFSDVAPPTLGLTRASPPLQQPASVDPPVAAATDLPPPPPLRSAAPDANEGSEPALQKPEDVPDGLVEGGDGRGDPIEGSENTAALDQANAPAGNPERSDRIATIQFARETAELGDAERDILRQVAALHQQRGGTIRIVGHGGASGQDDSTEAGADQVSLERADAVAQELIRLGVGRQNVRAVTLSGAADAEKTDQQTAEIYFIY